MLLVDAGALARAGASIIIISQCLQDIGTGKGRVSSSVNLLTFDSNVFICCERLSKERGEIETGLRAAQ